MIDPEASKIALTADFPNITIAGNVANQVFPSQEFADEVYSVPNPYSKLFHDYYDLSFPFWDETAAALMVDPSLATNQTSGRFLDATQKINTNGFSLSGCRYFVWQSQLWQHSCVPRGSCPSWYSGGQLCFPG